MAAPLLEVEGISKGFPGVQALDNVQFFLNAGEVLTIVGENGAGKSTLMKIITGIYTEDSGTIKVEGRTVDVRDPKHAQELGISIIHQETSLMPHLTVAQNIYIGREPRALGGLALRERALNRKAEELLQRLGIRLNARSLVGDLTIAKQQMVEIAKALSFDAKVLIMDEPTSALTESETETLFELIESLRESGTGIVYISHRMEELRRLADRVTVLRDGAYIGSLEREEIDIPTIIKMMVGRQIDPGARPTAREIATEDVTLKVTGLSTSALLKNVSFDLHRGEILGFAGLMGAGRTEVARAIIGADPITAGQIEVNGRPAKITQPSDAVRRGIGYLSEDRKHFGLLLDQSVDFNIQLASLKSYKGPFGFMRERGGRKVSESYVSSLRIRTPSVHQLVKNLSGGNQQKVVIAKWLARDCDILIFDEPTRGIDVGAKEEIYKLLEDLASEGKSIIMISSELPEVLRMSNRIAVMANGELIHILNNEEADQARIMDYATGAREEEVIV